MNPDTSSSIQKNNISTSIHASIEKTIIPEENTEVENNAQGKDQNNEVNTARTKINELDKFKRRLVRAVARLKITEKKKEDEIWDELKKETTWDCKSLWVRMRALTIKKLKRLCSVEDRLDMIAKVAHLSVTDWLMFDLVLVHEDVDVIGQEEAEENKEPKILTELFNLVQEYEIERLSGDSLTRSWYQLTQKYNVRGRKCSPMLLQRRWYQMKVLVRYNFYNFWFTYRGDMRKLPHANKYKPTDLQMEIAKYHKKIITNPFQTWEDLIKNKKVSLPSDFERLQLSKTKKKSLESEPDLVVIEPEVETIDLRIESDTSEDESSVNINKEQEKVEMLSENVNNVIVKTEVIDDLSDEEDVRVLESVEIPLESVVPKPVDTKNIPIIDETSEIITSATDYNTKASDETNGETEDETNDVTVIEENSNESMPENNNEGTDLDETKAVTVIDENSDESMPDKNGTLLDTTSNCLLAKSKVVSGFIVTNLTEKKTSKQSNVSICKAIDSQQNIDQYDLGDNTDVLIDNGSDARHLNCDNVEDNVSLGKGNKISESTEGTELVMPKITSVLSNAEIIENVVEDTADEINAILEGVVGKMIKNKFEHIKIPKNEFTIAKETSVSISPDIIDIDEEIAKVPNNSMTVKQPEPVTPTNNEPDDLFTGLEIVDDGIAFIDEENTTGIMNKTEQREDEKESNEENTAKIDLKLLLDPVVYTRKLDDMDVFRFIDYIAVKDGRVIENAIFESKPVDKKSVTMEHISEECQNEYESDICSDDASECTSHREIISSKSWLFRKPKILTYNPIQLCKNPDFNKRLNRLTAGFFSSERNRLQLKQCKPLTIDLHKSFEIKLKNNSLFVDGFENQVDKVTETVTAEKKTANPASDLYHNIVNAVDGSILSIPSIATTNESTLNATDNSDIPIPSSLASTDNSTHNDKINTTEKSVLSIPSIDLRTDELVKRSSHCIQSTPEVAIDINYNERNKIINLPNYDKIRRANEKLLIAEVAPIQVNKKPPVAIIQENHNQTLEKRKNDLPNKEYSENSPVISLIEINDNRDVPNEISNSLENTDPKKTITEKLSYYQRQKLNKSINEKLKKIIKPSAYKKITKPTPPPVKLVAPEYVSKESTIDRLLASDTVDRILSICQGDHGPSSKREQKNEAIKVRKKGMTVKNKVSAPNPTTAEYKFIDNPVVVDKIVPVAEKNKGTIEIRNKIFDETEICLNTTPDIRKYKNKRKKKKEYCCWAQEKMLYHKFIVQCVKSRHRCPPGECCCCCKELLENIRPRKNKENKIFPPIDLVSDEECEEDIDKPKVRNVGINTDYDPDFPGSPFAASMINNFDMHYVTQHVQELDILNSTSNNETQTSTFNNDEDTTKLMISENSGIKDTLKTKKVSPVITNIRSLSGPEQFLISKFKVNKKKPQGKFKCKTNIVPATPIKIAPKTPNSSSILQQAPESLSKIKMLTPDNNIYLINDKFNNSSSHKAICIGKHKILLCSFNPLNINRTTDDQVMKQLTSNNLALINSIHKESQSLLPHGVNLILLPNQEIALSIENGIELNPSQLSDLPAIIAKFQQQFNTKIFKQIKESCEKKLNTEEVIQLSDDESTEQTVKSNSPQKPSGMEIYKDDQNVVLMDNLKPNIIKASEMEISEVGLTDNLKTNMSTNMSNKLDVSDTIRSDVDEIPAHEYPEIASENVNLEDNTNPILKTDSYSEQTVNSVVKIQNKSNVDEKSVGDLGKKTILSDLMEMVGISEEDTGITNAGIQLQKQSEIIETPLETLSGNCSSEQIENKSQSGNNLARSAPLDLNIITSFVELKYAYENNGYFYKMDVETGKVAPINVCIKKQRLYDNQVSGNLVSKSVIDLTDEQGKGEQLISWNNAPLPTVQKSQQLTLKQPNQQQTLKSPQQKSPIKPIRLFKAIHTPIVKQSGKSLLMKLTKNNSEFQAKRKKLMLIRQKQKRDLQISDDAGTPTSGKANDASGTLKKIINNISDSDDEPLAFKVKRKRKEETVEETLEKPSDEEHAVINEITGNESSSASDVRNIAEKSHIDSINTAPQLEPIAYNDTSDEDCILGV